MLTRPRRHNGFTATAFVAVVVMAATAVTTGPASAYAVTGRVPTVSTPAFATGQQLAAPQSVSQQGLRQARSNPATSLLAPPPPPPPWAGELPPGLASPLLTDGTCQYQGGPAFNCHNATYGYYNPLDNCFWNLLSPQPPPGDPRWLGFSIAVGKVYNVTCETPLGLGVGVGSRSVQFSSQVPPGYAQSLTVNQGLAIAALLLFRGGIFAPTQVTAPTGWGASAPANHPVTPGLVGLPVWMWAAEGPLITILTKLGPLTPAIKILGISIGASLFTQRLEWDMGNGTTVNCAKDGTAFDPLNPATPTCTYTYTTPGTYVVDTRSVWFVTITAGAPLNLAASVLIVRSSLPQTITIDELQVVTQ